MLQTAGWRQGWEYRLIYLDLYLRGTIDRSIVSYQDWNIENQSSTTDGEVMWEETNKPK